MRRSSLLLSWLLPVAAALPAQESPWAEAQEQLFLVLDRFDPLDTSSLAFVRVAGDIERHGFLLGGAAPRLRGLDLETVAVAAADAQAADLAGFAAGLAQQLRQRQQLTRPPPHEARPGALMPPLALGLLTARACARRGLQPQLQALLAAMPSPDDVRAELAEGLHDWLQLSFADPACARAELLRRHQVWADEFGDHYRARQVEAMAATLAQMLQQEAAPAPPAGEPAVQAAALVARLCDQFAPVRGEAGCEFLTPVPDPDHSPAAALLALGLPAVPALLLALGDDRPSRCVQWCACGQDGRADCGFRVLPVRRLAADLLHRLSGLDFAGGQAPAKWRAWWEVTAAQGEAAGLLAVLRSGGADAAAAARPLLQRWPQHLDDAIAALQASDDPRVRRAMLAAVAAVPGPAPLPFLQRELQAAPFVSERVDAAAALLDRGRREGLDLLLAAWRAHGGDRTVAVDRDLLLLHDDERAEIAALLLTAGDVAAVRTVAGDLSARPVPVRALVLAVLARTPLPALLARAPAAQQAELAAAVEDLLAAALADRARGGAAPIAVPGGRPRNADLAAAALAALWPQRYAFAPAQPQRLRDLQIGAAAGRWCAARGLPPPAAPPPAGPGTDLRLDAGGLSAPPALQQAMAAARQRLDADALLQLLLAAAQALPGDCGHVAVEADRAGDGTGAVVLVTVERGRGRGGGGGLVYEVRAGETVLARGSRAGMRGSHDDAGDFADLRQPIAAALAAQPFAVVLALRWD